MFTDRSFCVGLLKAVLWFLLNVKYSCQPLRREAEAPVNSAAGDLTWKNIKQKNDFNVYGFNEHASTIVVCCCLWLKSYVSCAANTPSVCLSEAKLPSKRNPRKLLKNHADSNNHGESSDLIVLLFSAVVPALVLKFVIIDLTHKTIREVCYQLNEAWLLFEHCSLQSSPTPHLGMGMMGGWGGGKGWGVGSLRKRGLYEMWWQSSRLRSALNLLDDSQCFQSCPRLDIITPGCPQSLSPPTTFRVP